MALLVVGIGVQWWSTALPPVGGQVQGELRAAAVVDVVSMGGDVAQAPKRWEWRPVSGAVQYQVQILAVDGEELWHSTLTGQPYCDGLPESVFVARKTVAVKVTAFDGAGKAVAVSQETRLRVMPADTK